MSSVSAAGKASIVWEVDKDGFRIPLTPQQIKEMGGFPETASKTVQEQEAQKKAFMNANCSLVKRKVQPFHNPSGPKKGPPSLTIDLGLEVVGLPVDRPKSPMPRKQDMKLFKHAIVDLGPIDLEDD